MTSDAPAGTLCDAIALMRSFGVTGADLVIDGTGNPVIGLNGYDSIIPGTGNTFLAACGDKR